MANGVLSLPLVHGESASSHPSERGEGEKTGDSSSAESASSHHASIGADHPDSSRKDHESPATHGAKAGESSQASPVKQPKQENPSKASSPSRERHPLQNQVSEAPAGVPEDHAKTAPRVSGDASSALPPKVLKSSHDVKKSKSSPHPSHQYEASAHQHEATQEGRTEQSSAHGQGAGSLKASTPNDLSSLKVPPFTGGAPKPTAPSYKPPALGGPAHPHQGVLHGVGISASSPLGQVSTVASKSSAAGINGTGMKNPNRSGAQIP